MKKYYIWSIILNSKVHKIIYYVQVDKNILIPQAALAQDENGFYTFIVDDESIAQERRLVLGDVIGDKQVVKSGLKAKDKVVIKGIQKLKHGQKVEAALVSENKEM